MFYVTKKDLLRWIVSGLLSCILVGILIDLGQLPSSSVSEIAEAKEKMDHSGENRRLATLLMKAGGKCKVHWNERSISLGPGLENNTYTNVWTGDLLPGPNFEFYVIAEFPAAIEKLQDISVETCAGVFDGELISTNNSAGVTLIRFKLH